MFEGVKRSRTLVEGAAYAKAPGPATFASHPDVSAPSSTFLLVEARLPPTSVRGANPFTAVGVTPSPY